MRISIAAFAVVLACARLANAGPAPQAIASLAADVDGDGAIDQIFVGGSWGVGVSRGGGKDARVIDFALGYHPRAATLSAAGATIAAMIDRDDGTREGVGLALRGDALVLLWRGPVGPVGRDADYDVRIEATAAGLVRYQHRAGVERCDGEPARLFAEAWDGHAFRSMRPEIAVSDAAPEIAATATAPAGASIDRALVYRATAASAQAGASDAGELSTPRALDDGDATTAWRGPADGRGEFFTYRAKLSGARAAAVRIVGAHGRGRPARLAVVGGGRAYWIKLPERADGDGPLWAMLPEPISSPCVSIVIAAAKPDLAIAELAIVSDAELSAGGIEKALAAEVAAGGTDGVSAARVLAGRGAAGAQAVIAEIAARGAGDPAAKRRLVAALIEIGDPAGAASLAGALAAGEITGGDVERAIAVLAKMGAPGEASLVALAGDAKIAIAVRAAAIGGLGGGSPAAGDAIAALAGDPSPELRRAVIDALARRPTAELIDRARALAGAKAGDVWRAAALSAKGDAAALATVRAALRELLARGVSYDERYRAIEALGEGDDADVAAVAAAVRGLGDSAQAGALKQIAARALGRNAAGAAAAGAVLVELAADGDPGVRLAAISALAGREPAGSAGAWVDPTPEAARDSIDRVIGTALATDHWPEIRRAAAAALGARCARPGPAASLGAAIDGDRDDDVRGDALAALVACHAAGVGDRLWKIADDANASVSLRVRAVDLIVALGDASLARGLETRFASWRGGAFSDDASLQLAIHAAIALGRLGDRGALQALVDAAGDGAFPELAAAAATALGELAPCPPAVRQTLDALTLSDQRNVALAARRARARCAP